MSKDVIIPHTMTTFLDKPFQIECGQDYDIEHNLIPTDVKNHFSGAPITLQGADLWTCYGRRCEEKSEENESHVENEFFCKSTKKFPGWNQIDNPVVDKGLSFSDYFHI